VSRLIDFSIIIPTRDRPRQLEACLEAISKIELDGATLEVIVVDDGSTSPLDPIAEAFSDRLDLMLLRQENRGPAAARNTGAHHANGGILAFTDDDCLPSPEWLQKMAHCNEADPDRIIGGQTINTLDDNAFSTASQDLIGFLYAYYNADHKRAKFLTSNNIAVPYSAFDDIGGFDPAFPGAAAEDRDFCDRWRLSGYAMMYEPEAIVYHCHHLNLRTFWKQHFGYGRGAYRFHRSRALRQEEPLRVEPFGFYLGLLRYPLSRGHGRRAPLIAGLMALCQVANAAGFFWESACHRFRRKETQ
jgi:GT2 family glycosyltransferase